jgi:asparagine synthase (glutamine-hydrolysing)
MPAIRKVAREVRHRKLQKHPWYTAELSEYLPPESSSYAEPTLDSVLRQSVEQGPLPLYLRIEDRNSMAHSVEARMPFLDYRLVSLAFQLPVHWKMNGPWNKYVLRKAMHNHVPQSVTNRLDKFGFPAPVRKWFSNGLYKPMQDLLASRAVRERGIYEVDKITRDLELHRQGKVNMTSQLFNLAQFEIWCEIER